MSRNKDALRLAELRSDLTYSSALRLIRDECAKEGAGSLRQTGLRLIAAASKLDAENASPYRGGSHTDR
jgi:hypothetical protein